MNKATPIFQYRSCFYIKSIKNQDFIVDYQQKGNIKKLDWIFRYKYKNHFLSQIGIINRFDAIVT